MMIMMMMVVVMVMVMITVVMYEASKIGLSMDGTEVHRNASLTTITASGASQVLHASNFL